jgi:hypothetical protein
VGYSFAATLALVNELVGVGSYRLLRSDGMVTAGRSPVAINVGVGMPGISSRSVRMVGCGHSQAGSIT